MACPTCFTSWDLCLALLQLRLGIVAQKVISLYQELPDWGARGQGGHCRPWRGYSGQAQILLESSSPVAGTLEQLTEWIGGFRQGVLGQ